MQANEITAPASGWVKEITTENHVTRIVIFLPVHVDHNQYAPLEGRLTDLQYFKGTFHLAGLVKKTEKNERQELTFATQLGIVRVVQIAGVIARTITASVRVGEHVHPKQIIGHIAFGSRVDLYLPESVTLSVKKGQRVHARAVIGNW